MMCRQFLAHVCQIFALSLSLLIINLGMLERHIVVNLRVSGFIISLFSEKENQDRGKESVINCYPYSFMDNVCQ